MAEEDAAQKVTHTVNDQPPRYTRDFLATRMTLSLYRRNFIFLAACLQLALQQTSPFVNSRTAITRHDKARPDGLSKLFIAGKILRRPGNEKEQIVILSH
jgi:hypothetical protein